jgi:hypothetical protein
MADDIINLKDMFRAKSGQVTWNASDLTFDLRTDKLFEKVGPKMVERYVDAVGKAKGTPTLGTLNRRGSGPLFNVTGRFLAGVAFNVAGKGLKAPLTLVTGRLSPTVVRWLQFRVPGVRARALAKVLGEEIAKLQGAGIVKAGRKAG